MDALSDPRNINRQFEHETYEYANRLQDLTKGAACLWQSGVTFRNVASISVLYISGLIPTSPYHIGPILCESGIVMRQLQIMNRNGILTTASEPVQDDYNEFTGESFSVGSSSISFWILKRNEDILRNALRKYDREFSIETMDIKFSDEFGPSYQPTDNFVTSLFITDETGDNELFKILANISKVLPQ